MQKNRGSPFKTLSPETILWYRKRLHAKLDVHSAPELVAEVVRRKLLD